MIYAIEPAGAPNVLKQAATGDFPRCARKGAAAADVGTKADSVTAFDDFTFGAAGSR